MQLYNYFRSSASYRVRIALQIKGLAYDCLPVHLVKGEHKDPQYASRIGDALVPTLVTDGGTALSQSMAIIEYLDETHPTPALLPATPLARARVRALAQMVACDIHPLNNLRVLQYLEREWDIPADGREAWARHWMEQGLDAFEALVADNPATGQFCHGDAPGLADCCLVPQLYNARRFGLDVARWATLARIEQACQALPAFAAAAPEAQPDAPV